MTNNHRYDPHHAKCLRAASQRLLAALVREHPHVIYTLTQVAAK